ncbi:MAG: hypothetical protein O3A02_04165, partial [bacterium]|nr:hypothetical protein [bacterium]
MTVRRHRGCLLLPDGPAVGELVVEGARIVDVVLDVEAAEPDPRRHWWVPGFIDVHVHGGGGGDTMDGADGVRAVAAA